MKMGPPTSKSPRTRTDKPVSTREPGLFDSATDSDLPADYVFEAQTGLVVRSIRRRTGGSVRSSVRAPSGSGRMDAHASFDLGWLRTANTPQGAAAKGCIRMADLFCGAGGFGVGMDEAGRALGMRVEHVMAADIEASALSTFEANFKPRCAVSAPIETIVDGELGAKLTAAERKLRREVGAVDIATGGPPCQGHSDLNNYTRRQDPKNALYARMARFAEVIEPETVVIENVPGVRRDRSGIFSTTVSALQSLGYSVADSLIEMELLGVPQRRHRVIVVATKRAIGATAVLDEVQSVHRVPLRSVGWAISDLEQVSRANPMDAVTVLSAESMRRVDWLFDNDEYDLPNRLRPACHREKQHSYNAVYGRLYWDQPSWTITTGFQVMGQGRFLHPRQRRVITSHEAARLQFFPDYFRFVAENRKWYAKMIGNAVPPKLSFALGVALFR
jgi:DNA (cytosine-5)-methyltransferase 1